MGPSAIRTTSLSELKLAKLELNNKSRLFVTCSKLFVKSATEGLSTQLTSHLKDCIDSLQIMFAISGKLIMNSNNRQERDIASKLYNQIKDVAKMFRLTLDTVSKLKSSVENQFISQIKVFEIDKKAELDRFLIETAASSQYMSHLMNHATSLANSLSNLMKVLKELN